MTKKGKIVKAQELQTVLPKTRRETHMPESTLGDYTGQTHKTGTFPKIPLKKYRAPQDGGSSWPRNHEKCCFTGYCNPNPLPNPFAFDNSLPSTSIREGFLSNK